MKLKLTKEVVFSRQGLNTEVQETVSKGRRDIFADAKPQYDGDPVPGFTDEHTSDFLHGDAQRYFETGYKGGGENGGGRDKLHSDMQAKATETAHNNIAAGEAELAAVN